MRIMGGLDVPDRLSNLHVLCWTLPPAPAKHLRGRLDDVRITFTEAFIWQEPNGGRARYIHAMNLRVCNKRINPGCAALPNAF